MGNNFSACEAMDGRGPPGPGWPVRKSPTTRSTCGRMHGMGWIARQELRGALRNAPWNKHTVVDTWAGQPHSGNLQVFWP